jgi:hypothetical protein
VDKKEATSMVLIPITIAIIAAFFLVRWVVNSEI